MQDIKLRQHMRIFFRGLAALLPITGTVYLIYWLFISIERGANSIIYSIYDSHVQIPGLGILLTFLAIYLMGLLLGLLPFQFLLSKIQAPLRNIPLVKSIYSALEDLLQFFDKSDSDNQGRVVEVRLGDKNGFTMVGLLTSTDPLTRASTQSEVFAVYIPVSYQIGGYTIFVKPDQISYLDMSVEDLMKSALTAWIKK